MDWSVCKRRAADAAATEHAATFYLYEHDVRSAAQVMVIKVNKKITAKSQIKSLIPCS